MILNENQLYTKEFFFSGELNFTPNKTYTLTPSQLETLSKEQLGDLIEAECENKIHFNPALLATVMQKYVSLKFPSFNNKIIEKSNGVIKQVKQTTFDGTVPKGTTDFVIFLFENTSANLSNEKFTLTVSDGKKIKTYSEETLFSNNMGQDFPGLSMRTGSGYPVVYVFCSSPITGLKITFQSNSGLKFKAVTNPAEAGISYMSAEDMNKTVTIDKDIATFYLIKKSLIEI